MKIGGKKYLIVNADDFGQSPGVNQGIIKAHECGVVTSASLMVRWPAAAEAAAYSRQRPGLSLGLHLDLGEWTYSEGAWLPLYKVTALEDPGAVLREVAEQLAAFRRLTGREPSHVDSHQHVHQREPVQSVVVELADQLGVPLRHFCRQISYCGDFYGQTAEGEPIPNRISVDGLIQILERLSPGSTELSCHPALVTDLNTLYREERVQEVKVLCAPRIRQAVTTMHVELCSFESVPSPRWKHWGWKANRIRNLIHGS